MAGLCEGGNEPAGSLKAISQRVFSKCCLLFTEKVQSGFLESNEISLTKYEHTLNSMRIDSHRVEELQQYALCFLPSYSFNEIRL
ncbi:hypothetical protein ANN_25239 [Periplaneta americana]|uniref:Uncharacterized protein n=1 Tax=Periplaneta americana TaxID=6978 RepID=A0ABQ8S0Y9_PERAM|nr:hypothetical protein ANN_25239 [Periplaneta americana]